MTHEMAIRSEKLKLVDVELHAANLRLGACALVKVCSVQNKEVEAAAEVVLVGR